MMRKPCVNSVKQNYVKVSKQILYTATYIHH